MKKQNATQSEKAFMLYAKTDGCFQCRRNAEKEYDCHGGMMLADFHHYRPNNRTHHWMGFPLCKFHHSEVAAIKSYEGTYGIGEAELFWKYSQRTLRSGRYDKLKSRRDIFIKGPYAPHRLKIAAGLKGVLYHAENYAEK